MAADSVLNTTLQPCPDLWLAGELPASKVFLLSTWSEEFKSEPKQTALSHVKEASEKKSIS